MSENFSIDKLFNITKDSKISKEEYLMKCNQMKEDEASIFTDDNDATMEQIFSIMDTNKDNYIDFSEVKKTQSLGDDDDTTMSNEDVKKLYENIKNNITNSYQSTDPKTMYENAMKQSTSPSSSTYIQDLTTQIQSLEELKTLRQANSNNIINTLENDLANIIKQYNVTNTNLTTEYNELTEKKNEQERELDKNNQNYSKASTDLDDITTQIELINSDKDSTNEDELSSLNNDKESLTKKLSEYKTTGSKYDKSIAQLDEQIGTVVSKIKKDLPTKIQNKITQYQQKIETEKEDCKSDIKDYDNQIQILKAARTYAIQQRENIQPDGDSTNASGFSTDKSKLSSLNDVNYSSEKGLALAQAVSSKAKGFTGYCSRYVNNALEATNLGNGRTAAAAEMDDKLRNNKNFKEIKITSKEDLKNLPAGCVLVYERGAAGYSSKYGHIEVTLGNGTAASDGITHNLRYTENMSVFVPVA